MSKPRLLDLFCGAGGAAMGYSRAGFDVTGVDNKPQKNYPFEFILADALEYVAEYGHEYDAIHASPPCQAYSTMRNMANAKSHPLLIDTIRLGLKSADKPYAIENVIGARPFMVDPIVLCGQMFGVRVFRHRLFELSFPLLQPGHTHGKLRSPSKGQNSEPLDGEVWSPVGHFANLAGAREAMGVPWITTKGMVAQAIPPAYSEFIGKALMEHLEAR